MSNPELIKKLEETIENILDFPKPGIQFKDIAPIFLNPKLYEEVIEDLANFSRGKIDAVCGIESRGYLFGIAMAVALEDKKNSYETLSYYKTPVTIFCDLCAEYFNRKKHNINDLDKTIGILGLMKVAIDTEFTKYKPEQYNSGIVLVK